MVSVDEKLLLNLLFKKLIVSPDTFTKPTFELRDVGEEKSKQVPRSDFKAERTASPRRLAGREISYAEGRFIEEEYNWVWLQRRLSSLVVVAVDERCSGFLRLFLGGTTWNDAPNESHSDGTSNDFIIS
jgi:hypothetical protein